MQTENIVRSTMYSYVVPTENFVQVTDLVKILYHCLKILNLWLKFLWHWLKSLYKFD